MPAPDTRWGPTKRLEFIEFRLLWDGRVNRSQLIEFFAISPQQASLDFARYMEAAPANVEYDKSEKTYRPTTRFEPIYLPANTRHYLNQLLGVESGISQLRDTYLEALPSCGIVQAPQRHTDPKTLFQVLTAIRERLDLSIDYHSMRRGTTVRVWIAPHALAFDGMRWHVRAACHETNSFRDFVLSRIKTVFMSRPSQIDSSSDSRWHSIALLKIEPKKGLSPEQKVAVCAEFEMKGARLEIRIREALIFHFARLMRLLPGDEASQFAPPLEWKNRKDFLTVLAEATAPN